jgi:ornithine decarboxylase
MAANGFEAVGANLGGGLPCRYQDHVADVAGYGGAIGRVAGPASRNPFAGEFLIEPGRFLVGGAGLIEAEVVLISRRPTHDETRWVYLDIGMFNGSLSSVAINRHATGASPPCSACSN